MRPDGFEHEEHEVERYELDEAPRYTFKLPRRAFIQVVGTGLLITWGGGLAHAQRRGRPSTNPGTRFLIAKDGTVTAYTGKVEVGQGSRTQIAMAVAEEIGIPLEKVHVVMADTDLVPNDGGTWGSRTTPDTIPQLGPMGKRGSIWDSQPHRPKYDQVRCKTNPRGSDCLMRQPSRHN